MTTATAAQSEFTQSAQQGFEHALQRTLQLAVGQHQAGNLPEAAQLYRAVLESDPAQPQANHNLGMLLLQLNQPATALPHLEAALAVKPESERYWLSYIDGLALAGESEQAKQMLAFGREHGLEGEAVDALAELLDIALKSTQPTGVKLELGV